MASPPNPRAALVRQRIAVYNQTHPNAPIDDSAALAVAGTEGLSGRIGDGGHAFGDFQLNDAGGVLTHKFDGLTPQQKQAWASSPVGIDYALGGIGKAAGGLHGADAIRAIVANFERPADPQGEIARALAGLGGAGAGPSSPAPAAASPLSTALTAQAPTPDARRQFGTQLLAGLSPTGQLNQNALIGALAQRRQTLSAATPPMAPSAGLGAAASAPPVAGTGVGAAIAKTALTQLGTPYQWGGPAKLGSRTDCSGLLQASAAAHGVDIGRTTYEQYKQGAAVPLDQMQPGDAVFFHPGPKGPEHVAIYIGGGKVVEDPHTGATVEVSTLAGRGAIGARRYG